MRVTLDDCATYLNGVALISGGDCASVIQKAAVCRAAQAVVDAAREAEEALQDNKPTYAIALLQIALTDLDNAEQGNP